MGHPVNACIITIGDELLIGQVIDTNSAFIAQQLNSIGVWVKRRISVGDNAEDIRHALDDASGWADIVLITGGLGPTADDITKPFLCSYFGGTMIVDENVMTHNRHLFENVFKRPFTERNEKQAEVPDVCTVIENPRGTAPGMLFEKNDVIFISMPGVPHEMKGMMTQSVLPLLQQRFQQTSIEHRTLLTAGIGESFLADHIMHWENQLPPSLKLAYLPNYGMVRLRLTRVERSSGSEEIQQHFDALQKLVQPWLVTNEDKTMPQVVSDLLNQHGRTLSTAESCTGGYISSLLTRLAGASSFFQGGVISYSNDVKQSLLRVQAHTLESAGAVSEDTVIQMAHGALDELHTDYALAISGIMGPSGGSESKPVGLVWVAAASRQRTTTQQFNFRFDRERNIEMAAINALNVLRKFIIETES